MSKISKIEQCAKRKNRVNIFVDGEFFCAIFDEVCAKQKLKVGQEIDENRLKEILEYEEQQKCDLCAVKYLEKFFKTKKEVLNYLTKKGFDILVAQTTIDKCKEYGYVNDEVFTKSFINSKVHTCSIKQIEYELNQKGIEKIPNDFLENIDETETIKVLAEKYFKNKEISYENITKFKASAYRKGFKLDCINKALDNFKEGKDEDWN